MTHDEEKYLQQKMESASLKELFPEFDKEAEWMALSNKMRPRSVPDHKWMRAAAVLLIVLCLGGYVLYVAGNKMNAGTNVAVGIQSDTTVETQSEKSKPDVVVDAVTVPQQQHITTSSVRIKRTNYISNRPSPLISAMALATGGYGKTTEAICNATKCAIEICISQTVKCKDKAPAAVADCRTLEPDQAGPLKYTDPERYGCTVTVDEIRIKKVATGETIVINSDTQPASAEEMLQCFTGEKKCDMLAGFFNSDCNDENSPRKITIDSHYGDVIIQ